MVHQSPLQVVIRHGIEHLFQLTSAFSCLFCYIIFFLHILYVLVSVFACILAFVHNLLKLVLAAGSGVRVRMAGGEVAIYRHAAVNFGHRICGCLKF